MHCSFITSNLNLPLRVVARLLNVRLRNVYTPQLLFPLHGMSFVVAVHLSKPMGYMIHVLLGLRVCAADIVATSIGLWFPVTCPSWLFIVQLIVQMRAGANSM